MNRPTTAREALIAEALGEVASLLDRVETLMSSMDAGRVALAHAGAALDQRLSVFEAGMSCVTQQDKTKTVEHIVRRTDEAARQSIEVQTRSMHEAARLAFTAQLEPTLARLTNSLQRLIQRVDRPWDHWLTHAATAVSSAAITWFVAATFGIR